MVHEHSNLHSSKLRSEIRLSLAILLLLALVPLGATAAGYMTQSVSVEYVTLAVLAALAVGFYLLLLPFQGEALQKRELAIHEAVNDPEE